MEYTTVHNTTVHIPGTMSPFGVALEGTTGDKTFDIVVT